MISDRAGKPVSPPNRSILQGRGEPNDNVMSGTGTLVPANGKGTAGAVTVFASITHPMLTQCDLVSVSKFARERERYEQQIQEKMVELPSLKAASYLVSIDKRLVKTMHFAGELITVAPDVAYKDLSSDHVKAFVYGLVKKTDKIADLKVITRALKGLKVPMAITDPKARMLQYLNDFLERLETVGYGDFADDNPKKTVALL